MKKDFITVSQSSGQGNVSVRVEADPNPLINDRQTALNFSTNGGVNKQVRVIQGGIPWVMLSSILFNYQSNKYPTVTEIKPNEVTEENGLLVFKIENLVITVNATNPPWFVFYSDPINTFTLEVEGVTYTFTKYGNIHGLEIGSEEDLNTLLYQFMLGLSGSGNLIKFNGTPIIKIIRM